MQQKQIKNLNKKFEKLNKHVSVVKDKVLDV